MTTNHAHFICRACYAAQCDHGDGHVQVICACGAATWCYAPATPELFQAAYPLEDIERAYTGAIVLSYVSMQLKLRAESL
jgi:hypothetical protein